jgi:RHS repeat-associated protein
MIPVSLLPGKADMKYPASERLRRTFGLEMAGLGSTAAGTVENKYLYNGKKKEDDLFGDKTLMWYHYSTRYYPARDAFRRDPQLGRWHSLDPIEQYYSNYNYVGCNPINFTDKDGRFGGASAIEFDFFFISISGTLVFGYGKWDKFQIGFFLMVE